MKKQLLSAIIILSSFHNLYSQGIEKETWAEKPAIHNVDAKYGKESAVVIFDKRKIEYIDEKQDVAEYYTLHKIIHINDDKGIESFNKIYLGVSETSDLTDVKARTITPDGKIIEFNKSNIKDLKEEDGNTYKIFALDGLSKGCDIEYYYTVKRSTSYFGREVVQSSFPVLKTTIQIIKPERLRFEIKPYNCVVVPIDTLLGTKKFTEVNFEATPGAEDEKYAFYDANLKRIEFKLSYNDAKQKGERVFTWNELARRIFTMYTYFNDKEVKKVQDIVKNNNWDGLGDEVKKIVAVESYVKKNYSYNEELKSDAGNSIESILKNKIGGTEGMVRLYTIIFQSLGIKYQYVLTGDRTKFIIDRGFENWNNCDYPLFYFPTEAKFMAPTRPDYRYPLIYPNWGNANGLFCRTTSIGSFTTAIADVRPIELEDYKRSYDNIESKLELNPALDSLTIDAKQIFDGYPAVNYRDAFNFSNEDQKKTMVKEMAKMVASTDHILFSEALNKDFESTDLPFIMHTKTKSGELIEKAGNKLLLKIGMAIGPQVEMYQEKPRQQPINIDYGHIEKRRIEFTIPAGYTITNPNDIKIDQTYKDDGELTMGFVSTYEIKGNLLIIDIMEEYHKTLYPLNQFADFRRIINASSDFNKVVLVLQKI